MIVLDTEADARLPSCGLPMLCKFYFVFFEDHNKVLKKEKFSSLYVYLLLKKIFPGIDY